MRPPRPITEQGIQEIQNTLQKTSSKADYQRVQCVWLRACLGLSVEQIALAIGWKSATVRQVHSIFLRKGAPALLGKKRGGPYHQNLDKAEEQVLLERFRPLAEQGGMLLVHEVKAAYEIRVCHPVPYSTIYRMLARHGWRKIVPRPRHPKADKEAQETFKKTLPPL